MAVGIITTMTESRLRMLQLASPALPVGAYAYSQGLESAVELGWVRDEPGARDWILGLLSHSLARLDAPVLARLHGAWQRSDNASVEHWTHWLYAARESFELQQEDRHLGQNLARLLVDLELSEAAPWRGAERVCFATLFALATARWRIPAHDAVGGYLWTWTENQVMAATKLVPLGQTAGQRILSAAIPAIERTTEQALALPDHELGFSAPGLALAAARHETQYSRLFRS
jgi:urease accessory protein